MQVTTVKEYLQAIKNGPICQPDALTCQSTCIFAVTGGTTSIGHIREDLLQLGTAGDPAVMAQYLRDHFGDRYALHMTASINDMRSMIRSGSVLITHGWLTDAGHVFILDGVNDRSFRVMDSWEEFDGVNWTYPSDLESFQGNYSDALIWAACVAGNSVDDAHWLYENQAIDRSQKGAWVHEIKPGV
ncbi:MAG: hypothetical protein ACRC62_20005, partial [Microcoleus sp.]